MFNWQITVGCTIGTSTWYVKYFIINKLSMVETYKIIKKKLQVCRNVSPNNPVEKYWNLNVFNHKCGGLSPTESRVKYHPRTRNTLCSTFVWPCSRLAPSSHILWCDSIGSLCFGGSTFKHTYTHSHLPTETHTSKRNKHRQRHTLVYAHIPAFFLILFVGLSLLAMSYVNILNLLSRVGGILKGLDGQRVDFWGCSEFKNSI